MATHKKHARSRRYRKLIHQNAITPVKTIAHLNVLDDFNLTRFCQHLRRKAPCPLYVKIEQTSETSRPHFHIMATETITKDTLKTCLQRCLQGERIDLRVEDFVDEAVKAWCWYIAKNTAYKGRCDFTIGKFFTENTQELCKTTSQERRRTILRMLWYGEDGLLLNYILHGIIPDDILNKPSFPILWKNHLRYDGNLAQNYELALLNSGWDATI